MSFGTNTGRSFPLGATVYPEGVNFSVFSKGATGVELLLFRGIDSPRPERIVTLAPRKNRTYHYWHVFVPGVKPGQIYGYRASRPWAPERGARFDLEKILLDPYGRAVVILEQCFSHYGATRSAQVSKVGDAVLAVILAVADHLRKKFKG